MTDDPHQFTRDAWEVNAEVWDARMGDEGNDFFNLLCWPAMLSLLNVQPGRHYLDIACGNGLTSRRLAALGAQVTAFDFTSNLIEKAKARSTSPSRKCTLSALCNTISILVSREVLCSMASKNELSHLSLHRRFR